MEYDPVSQQMRTVVDCMHEIGSKATGFAAQSKIHTRNNVGASGKIYFGTKQGYPDPKKAKLSPTIPAVIRWYLTRRQTPRASIR